MPEKCISTIHSRNGRAVWFEGSQQHPHNKQSCDFEVYFVKHLKEQQKDDATQTDESYTLDEKQILKNTHERRSANSENCSTIHQRPIPVLLHT